MTAEAVDLIGLFGTGKLAAAIADEAGSEAIWQIGRGEVPPVSTGGVAIDASLPDAVDEHLRWAVDTGNDLVIAVTGWPVDLPDLAARIDDQIGVLVAPNGSLMAALLGRLTAVLGAFAGSIHNAQGYILDHHHGGKRDAPSGTALALARAWQQGSRELPAISSIRAGHEVGHHVVALDGVHECLEIHHRVRSRQSFARGLLSACRWLRGRRGVFTMEAVAADLLDPLLRPLNSQDLATVTTLTRSTP